MKKEWNKPVVIILTRGASEEMVLSICKGGPEGSGGGPLSPVGFCYLNHENGDECNTVGRS